MKCPMCGETLRPGKKDPNYLLCYSCKKKFKVPPKKEEEKKKEQTRKQSEEKKYSNIPPKSVREKREREMKQAYDEMLAVTNENRGRKSRRRAELDYDRYDDYDDRVSGVPVIILGVAILIVAGIIVYMLLR